MRSNQLPISPKLQRVIEEMERGTFGSVTESHYLLDTIRNGHDHYLVNADFDDCKLIY